MISQIMQILILTNIPLLLVHSSLGGALPPPTPSSPPRTPRRPRLRVGRLGAALAAVALARRGLSGVQFTPERGGSNAGPRTAERQPNRVLLSRGGGGTGGKEGAGGVGCGGVRVRDSGEWGC